MDYAIELQRIIDALKEDKEAHPKWRNKCVARMEELQPWMLMLYETPSFDVIPAQAAPTLDDIAAGMTGNPAVTATLTMADIPPELREHVDPNQVQP